MALVNVCEFCAMNLLTRVFPKFAFKVPLLVYDIHSMLSTALSIFFRETAETQYLIFFYN